MYQKSTGLLTAVLSCLSGAQVQQLSCHSSVRLSGSTGSICTENPPLGPCSSYHAPAPAISCLSRAQAPLSKLPPPMLVTLPFLSPKHLEL